MMREEEESSFSETTTTRTTTRTYTTTASRWYSFFRVFAALACITSSICGEILQKLESGELEKSLKTITLDWYNEITRWHEIVNSLEINGRMIHD